MHRPSSLGHLHDDLGFVAVQIYRAAFKNTVDVWVDDAGRVVSAATDVEASVPVHWRVGTFSTGVSVEDIADDLRTLQSERAKDWVVD